MAKPDPEVTSAAPDTAPADALDNHWVGRWLPASWRPYARLSRLDRPIGTWLLLLPGWWSIALARPPGSSLDIGLILLFGIGALTMRGAGCTFNDIVDRDFDARVERTRNRPLPSGQVKPWQAWAWLVAQSLLGFVILVSMNRLAIGLGVASLLLVAIYPFMKRVTWWPQFFLGLAFNWGAVLGYAAVAGRLDLAPLVLYAAGIIWTLGYDTIYALQDKEDDALIGVKSTARLFGQQSRQWIAGFFALAWLGIGLCGALAGMGIGFWLCLAALAGHMAWQVLTLQPDDPADCLIKFRANRDAGLIVFLGFLIG
ncbi:4-hydroxybenzoate octaprenyltransferase [Ferrovibrio sp. MS7]|jgi:4-hydroxybenzoate polyprenyltransferase|uniref:4-hydroxybenzoate octaprenyltransferase n=1 Tax=Ferrovibrio plantarum TaxID=3119164 RepID=UPI003135216A